MVNPGWIVSSTQPFYNRSMKKKLSKTLQWIMPSCLALYVVTNFTISSVHHIGIMHPLGFLWGAMFFLIGPTLFLIAVTMLVLLLLRRPMSRLTIASMILVLILIPLWTFGFWSIGSFLRPVMFSIVEPANTRLADQLIAEYPPEANSKLVGLLGHPIRDFRYPLTKMNTYYTFDGEVLNILVKFGPGSGDAIIYDPKNIRNHSTYQHLSGAWWYIVYEPEKGG